MRRTRGLLARSNCGRWLGFQPTASNASATLVPTLAKHQVAAFIATIAEQIDDPAAGCPVCCERAPAACGCCAPASPGLIVDQDTALERILAASVSTDQREVSLPVRVAEPTFSGKDTDALAFQDLLGDGRSTFEGSPHERANNIEVAASNLNGVVIQPGHDFSFLARDRPDHENSRLSRKPDNPRRCDGARYRRWGVPGLDYRVSRAAFWAGLPDYRA